MFEISAPAIDSFCCGFAACTVAVLFSHSTLLSTFLDRHFISVKIPGKLGLIAFRETKEKVKKSLSV